MILIGVKTFQNTSLKITILCFSFAVILGIIAVISILTYKEKFLQLDINKWKNKGAWKDKGINAKLEVIGDWISN